MSATRDKSQKITFIYKNFHELYRKGKEAAKQAPDAVTGVRPGLTTGQILKVDDLNAPTFAAFTPTEFIGKRIETAEAAASVRPMQARGPAIESLKQNLKELNDLHSRLKFMLQELEELSKGDE